MFEGPSQPQVVGPQPYILHAQWSGGPFAFAWVAREQLGLDEPPNYDLFLGQPAEEQYRWFTKYTVGIQTTMDPIASQVT